MYGKIEMKDRKKENEVQKLFSSSEEEARETFLFLVILFWVGLYHDTLDR